MSPIVVIEKEPHMDPFQRPVPFAPPTALREEHRLRPHSDERPGVPRRDAPPDQTPASHRAPVTVEARPGAHRPQGPGQGGPPSRVRVHFQVAAVLHSL